jgi:hypothetical protein
MLHVNIILLDRKISPIASRNVVLLFCNRFRKSHHAPQTTVIGATGAILSSDASLAGLFRRGGAAKKPCM